VPLIDRRMLSMVERGICVSDMGTARSFKNLMEQSPSCEANIPHILQNLKFHYCIHNGLPSFPILNQASPCRHIPHLEDPF